MPEITKEDVNEIKESLEYIKVSIDQLLESKSKKGGKGKKREPSTYNKWISQCMGDMGLSMRECAGMWSNETYKEYFTLNENANFQKAKQEAEAEV